MNNKRVRSVNWDEEEKQLLKIVLRDYSHIIENKCLRTNTNKSKLKAWEEVHKKFNDSNSRPRELYQLQLQWKSMKMMARKKKATFKQEHHKTGGGKKVDSPTNEDIEITDLLKQESMTDYNDHDCDGVTFEVPMVSSPDTVKAVIAEGSSFRKEKKQRQWRLKSNVYKHIDRDYTKKLIEHSQQLKEKEHKKRLEMAAEEHAINMLIAKEKLESAKLEKEIWKLKFEKENQTHKKDQ